MTEIPDYQKATNATYETLIMYKAFSFPINIFYIISQMKQIKMYTYAQLKHLLGKTNDIFPSDYGFTILDIKNGKRIIAYNSNKDYTTARFTLAHELGNTMLNHSKEGDVENKEANCFARNLLCPVPVVDEMRICTSEEYQNIFYVSPPMAELSKQFFKSDKHYITDKNYWQYNSGVFYQQTGYTPNQFYNLLKLPTPKPSKKLITKPKTDD